MEKDEKLLKDLLQEGFLTKAPDNFTDRVMLAVAETESQQETTSRYSALVYSAIIIGSILAIFGILFYTNKSIFEKYQNYFYDFIVAVISPFSGVLNKFANLNFQFPYNSLLMGVGLIIIGLLAFDRFVLNRKSYLNLFV
jgi:hypothetical protein